jgi:hypothetical protein
VLTQQPLHWTEYSLPLLNLAALSQIEGTSDAFTSTPSKRNTEKAPGPYRDFEIIDSGEQRSSVLRPEPSAVDLEEDPPEQNYPEADSIDMDAATLSEESQEKAKQHKKKRLSLVKVILKSLKAIRKNLKPETIDERSGSRLDSDRILF